MFRGKRACDLRHQRGFTDTRVSSDQNEGGGNDAAPEYGIEFGDPG